MLGALSDLGRLAVDAPAEGRERYRCSLTLRDGVGGCSGTGLTLTSAAVRCLLEAEEGIAALAADGLAELQRSWPRASPGWPDALASTG